MKQGSRITAALLFAAATVVAAQPVAPRSAPFAILPKAERPGGLTTRVPVTVVLSDGRGETGTIEVWRLRPSGTRWPAWRFDSVATTRGVNPRAVLWGEPGEETLLLLMDEQAGYRLDGPFRWPTSADVRTPDATWRRTLQGRLPQGLSAAPSFVWVSAARMPAAGSWPTCGLPPGGNWECVGVPWDEPGVVLLAAGPPVRFGVAPAMAGEPSSVQLVAVREAAWCRLARAGLTTAPWVSLRGLSAVARREPHGSGSRLGLVRDGRVSVEALAADAFWVCGSADPDGGVLHVAGPQVATTDVPFDGWERGPPELLFDVMLDAPIRLAGRVVAAKSQPAPQTSILVSEVKRRQSEKGETPPGAPARPRLLVEVTADESGAFEVPGLQAREYELLALHPTLGRATKTVVPDGRDITLTLVAPHVARGRVVRDGQPVPRILVARTPALSEYAAGADPFELLSLSQLTDENGRFELALPPKGTGELRVGVEETGMVRIPLPAAENLPASLELGDIELRPTTRLMVEVFGASGCDLYASGPFGSAGLTVVRGDAAPNGAYTLRIPEAGQWLLTLTCGRREVPLAPPLVEIPPGEPEVHARVTVRDGG